MIKFRGEDTSCSFCDFYKYAQADHVCQRGKHMGYKNCWWCATTKPESGNPASEKLPDDIKEKFKRFVDEQVSLPSTFADVVNENFWDLI
jgi:hypothetical protein